MLRITLDRLLAMEPCDPESRVALFGERKTVNAKQALAAGASIEDVLWVVGKLGRKDLCVRFALACAQRTAHLNRDPRVQNALASAQAWIDNPSLVTAAEAARSAAEAARSAEWSARSAAEAEAEWSARSAEWSARSAEIKAQKKLLIEILS